MEANIIYLNRKDTLAIVYTLHAGFRSVFEKDFIDLFNPVLLLKSPMILLFWRNICALFTSFFKRFNLNNIVGLVIYSSYTFIQGTNLFFHNRKKQVLRKGCSTRDSWEIISSIISHGGDKVMKLVNLGDYTLKGIK